MNFAAVYNGIRMGRDPTEAPITLANATARNYPMITDAFNRDIGTVSKLETGAKREMRLAWKGT